MKNFWIVTPCWKRPEITEIVFQEFRWAIKKASPHLNLNVVVVGNDENIDIAKKFGFHVVVRDNSYLGRKFNDGYLYAFKNGADAVMPVGSDSWVHPKIFIKTAKIWEDDGSIYYSTKHSMIDESGSRLGVIQKFPEQNEYNKCPLLFYPRSLMKGVGFRPCNEKQNKSCDRSTLEVLIKTNKNIKFVKNFDVNDFQYLALKNRNVQIWKYDDYQKQFIKEYKANTWSELEKHYPVELVSYAKKYYRK